MHSVPKIRAFCLPVLFLMAATLASAQPDSLPPISPPVPIAPAPMAADSLTALQDTLQRKALEARRARRTKGIVATSAGGLTLALGLTLTIFESAASLYEDREANTLAGAGVSLLGAGLVAYGIYVLAGESEAEEAWRREQARRVSLRVDPAARHVALTVRF